MQQLINRPLLDGLWSPVDSRYTMTRIYLAKGFGKLDRTTLPTFELLLKQLDIRFRRTNASDSDALFFVHNFMNLLVYPISGYPVNENLGRADSRCQTIEHLLHDKAVPCPTIDSLVDIGCSSGSITNGLKELFNLLQTQIHGIDVLEPSRVLFKNKITYHQVVNTSNPVLPFADNSISIVTMLMSLHHIQFAKEYIDEAYRILKHGGILIIKEHDVHSENVPLAQALNALHGLYSIAWAKQGEHEDPLFPLDFFAAYKSKEEWTLLIKQSNFEHIPTSHYTSSDCYRNYKQVQPAHVKNAMFSYWGTYIKR